MLEDTDEEAVWVRRQWNDWREAAYPLSAIEDLHWSDLSGGARSRAPRPFLHGYVWCDGMLEGDLGHSCAHGAGPHRIKVCITRKSNKRRPYEELAQRARKKNTGAR